MPDAYTDTSALDTVTLAYERKLYFALRSRLHFAPLATVKPTAQTHNGSSVRFTFYDDLTEATSELTQTSDVTAVAMSDEDVTVVLKEYGNAAISTMKLRALTYAPTFDADAANIIARNAVASIDTLAKNELLGGSQVFYADGVANQGSIGAGNTLGAAEIRTAVAELRSDAVDEITDGLFMGFIHPDTSVDLRTETGAAAWVEPVNSMEASRRWRGLIGSFEGVGFVETPRLTPIADAGSGNVDVYETLIVGNECLASAYSRMTNPSGQPTVVLGPVTDKLKRFQPIGWYWLGGFKRFREASIVRIESSSSLGANS